ncbi:MAG: AAA family ATPase [Okeania sp. SIO2F4]|uniref:DUF4435 domain-containing protein n=1 Tax=Okeania sp. SIO2F4 TaxID=2607790 RepID=UPI00142BA12F|nr:DUF4435 domain-containing protein [Okeania sp. SIO2F4]NES01390.1 AAA family ATPase [Okeania sp. SIO2F4]
MQENINLPEKIEEKKLVLPLPKSGFNSDDFIKVQDNSNVVIEVQDNSSVVIKFRDNSSAASVVIVGANGSGKTRLGSWIENNLESPQTQRYSVHRVAAQKSLSIPDFSPTSSMEVAKNMLYYGLHNDIIDDTNFLAYKLGNKWRSKPNTSLQNDYDKLLTCLFTEEYQENAEFRQAKIKEQKQAQIKQQPENIPETLLDTIKRIWESVILHRELITTKAGKIEACPKNGETYHSAEMSDGERVIFYLIGQCLAAKKNSIIVIDEPELHLHKALQNRLWDAIEAERPDCLFVYLTHDLDFAVTRVNSTKIWVKSYENNQWDWSLIPETENLPERLLLEIMGSRKPILFIESKGGKESLDFLVYSHIYTDYTVIPCGGCSEVINATRSFSKLKNLHKLECVGIIDRDYRTDEQIANLPPGIYCLNFSEIENIFLSESVLKVVANSLRRDQDDIKNLIQKTKELVFSHMEREKKKVVCSIVAAEIRESFKNFKPEEDEEALKQSFEDMSSQVNPKSLYLTKETLINKVLNDQNYSEALRLYNNKGLINQISSFFPFKGTGLKDYVKRLISHNDKAIIEALRYSLPELPIPQDNIE